MARWVKFTGLNISGDELKIGKIPIFRVFHDGAAPAHEDKKYKVTSSLPGVKPYLGHFLKACGGRDHAEHILRKWLKDTELQEAPVENI